MKHISESIIGRRGATPTKQDKFQKIFTDKNNIYVIIPHTIQDVEVIDGAVFDTFLSKSNSDYFTIKRVLLKTGKGAFIFTGPGRDFSKLQLNTNHIDCDIYWTPNGYNETILKFISQHSIKYPYDLLNYPDDFSLIRSGRITI